MVPERRNFFSRSVDRRQYAFPQRRRLAPYRLNRSASPQRSATTDRRSETIASINSRRLRWHCLFSLDAASTADITRPHIRATIGAAFTLGTCPTPMPTREIKTTSNARSNRWRPISGWRSQDNEFANLIVYSRTSNGCASRMPIALLCSEARAPRVGA